MASPLAKRLFSLDGVSQVFFGADFVTVTKKEDFTWPMLKPDIFAAIMDHYSSGMSDRLCTTSCYCQSRAFPGGVRGSSVSFAACCVCMCVGWHSVLHDRPLPIYGQPNSCRIATLT